MHQISVIDYIDSLNNGPISAVSGDLIHLRQGDLDGACGHHSFMMILIMLGKLERQEARNILSLNIDKRTRIGKFTEKVREIGYFQGTFASDIERIFGTFLNEQVELISCAEHSDATGVEIREFVKSHVEKNEPVMLAIDFPGGAHWVVVVGLDFAGEGDDKELYRFLVLDPGFNSPKFGFWNGALSYKSTKGPYPYTWFREDGEQAVKFTSALAFRSKT